LPQRHSHNCAKVFAVRGADVVLMNSIAAPMREPLYALWDRIRDDKDLFGLLRDTEKRIEGRKAFQEKRKRSYCGKQQADR
jgi:hypothetical protein